MKTEITNSASRREDTKESFVRREARFGVASKARLFSASAEPIATRNASSRGARRSASILQVLAGERRKIQPMAQAMGKVGNELAPGRKKFLPRLESPG